ncbi:peptidoglycan editing factor PgeF [Paenibacillus antarcticus]|uniref:Purine nucleoside phosphorylase n=1 Tax=Paenibacillus antarcticus TaxID=253703 RepID=A0A168PC05_9BACL|nr:peptidoglycan editing factor PgeF [Paenibacillus antarcticus]OAB46617.1 multicopper polyphenol oxidase [Paenibacillus antarcticus]
MEPFVVNNRKDEDPALFLLAPWTSFDKITVGFTGRHGGTSKSPYESLNCAFHVDDDPGDVIINRHRIVETLGFPYQAWTCGEQVHSNHVEIVHLEDQGRGNMDQSSAFQNTDGLLTNIPGVLLTSFYADCVPLYFYDPIKQVIGLAHAGWKGTVSRIASTMVDKMVHEYGSDAHDIRAAIGPSIGSCCYEVDDKVMLSVYDLEKDVLGNNTYSTSWYLKKNNGKSMLNLKEMNRQIMMKAGIMPSHIECTTYCTSCRNDLFFSYRKDGGTTGRMASWLGLK